MYNKRLNRHSCYFCGYNNVEKLNYFKFPTATEKRMKWIEACHISPLVDIKNVYLCNRHFLTSDIVTDKQRILLKSDAVPSSNTIPSQNLDEHDTPEELVKKTRKRSHHTCIICRNTHGNNFFRFPKDEYMRNKWMKVCSLTSWVPHLRVCDKHFSSEDYYTNDQKTGQRRRLQRNAVPSKVDVSKTGSHKGDDTHSNVSSESVQETNTDAIAEMDMNVIPEIEIVISEC